MTKGAAHGSVMISGEARRHMGVLVLCKVKRCMIAGWRRARRSGRERESRKGKRGEQKERSYESIRRRAEHGS